MDNWKKNKLWGPLAAGQLDLQVIVCVREKKAWSLVCEVNVCVWKWKKRVWGATAHTATTGKIEGRFSMAGVGSKLFVLDGEFALAWDVTMIFILELTSIYIVLIALTHLHTHTGSSWAKLLQKTKPAFKWEKETLPKVQAQI